MTRPLFLYGTLCHAPLREVVLGLGHVVREASLPGYRVHWADGADYPVIALGEGAAAGLLVDGLDAEARARVDLFELGFGYAPAPVRVEVEGQGAAEALVYLPDDPAPAGARWDLGAWAATWGEIWVEAAREALASGSTAEELARRWGMMKLRAASRLRAAEPGPGHVVRTDLSAARDVEVVRARHPYTEFFALADHDLRFRRFDGGMSPPVRRAGFIGGDAATVLPYDPVLDAVLVLEQFRAGPYFRGDPRPWTLEPIAGRIDPGESIETTLVREAWEEARLEVGQIFRVGEFYPSPGAVTEYVYSYVGLADLAGRGGEVGGVAHEDEDIHSHVIPFETLMNLVASGEAGTAPLVMSAYWLAMNRDRLRASVG